MKEEIKALIDYRLQEAKEAREEAEILLEKGKTRGALNRVYYSMFYAALALLAKHQFKVGDKLAHKVVADTLIAQFLTNKRLAKLIESYEDSKETALEIVGTEERAYELVESFDQERRKRHRLQYELGEEAKQNLAKTSLERASAFVAEVRQILRSAQ